jgi:hypothetical protein
MPADNILQEMMIPEQENKEYDPLVPFTYDLKSPESRRQYPRRLKVFLRFFGNSRKSYRAG